MFVPMCRIWLLLLLGGFVVPGVRHVSAIEIHTAADVEAVNGTSVKLKCTFSSSQPVSLQSVTVSWNFRPLSGGTDESAGRFKGHAVWSGDILRRDVSISLHEVKPTFNGTFTCEVRNPPDVQGSNGEIVFRVVDKVSLSEIGILAAAVGGTCAVILVLLCIFVGVRYYRKKQKQKENDFEANYRAEEWKEPTVW
ncbi:Myelin protein zero-like protein 2 [Collichthys lucidus]|uniref:Myelin protein zero-like protein 2 n=1 Tax=Collichthys lucidus TaxID=240159 RepID=A0A4U5V766_COLLU|nr:Myelin protein zero-like protein 2 [Collichthys lucidus]